MSTLIIIQNFDFTSLRTCQKKTHKKATKNFHLSTAVTLKPVKISETDMKM